jgi:hypothetical protein
MKYHLLSAALIRGNIVHIGSRLRVQFLDTSSCRQEGKACQGDGELILRQLDDPNPGWQGSSRLGDRAIFWLCHQLVLVALRSHRPGHRVVNNYGTSANPGQA